MRSQGEGEAWLLMPRPRGSDEELLVETGGRAWGSAHPAPTLLSTRLRPPIQKLGVNELMKHPQVLQKRTHCQCQHIQGNETTFSVGW